MCRLVLHRYPGQISNRPQGRRFPGTSPSNPGLPAENGHASVLTHQWDIRRPGRVNGKNIEIGQSGGSGAASNTNRNSSSSSTDWTVHQPSISVPARTFMLRLLKDIRWDWKFLLIIWISNDFFYIKAPRRMTTASERRFDALRWPSGSFFILQAVMYRRRFAQKILKTSSVSTSLAIIPVTLNLVIVSTLRPRAVVVGGSIRDCRL